MITQKKRWNVVPWLVSAACAAGCAIAIAACESDSPGRRVTTTKETVNTPDGGTQTTTTTREKKTEVIPK